MENYQIKKIGDVLWVVSNWDVDLGNLVDAIESDLKARGHVGPVMLFNRFSDIKNRVYHESFDGKKLKQIDMLTTEDDFEMFAPTV